jgi:hypothetical protein
MAANYYPAYMNYDGWVLKYLSQQREMAALVFGERPWNAAEDFRNACLFFRYHNARGARYYNHNLKGTVHDEWYLEQQATCQVGEGPYTV